MSDRGVFWLMMIVAGLASWALLILFLRWILAVSL